MSKNFLLLFHDPLDYKPDFKSMSPREKLRYIWDYEKLPIAIICIIIVLFIYIGWRYATYTNPILYGAAVNITIDEELTDVLEKGYLAQRPAEIKKRRDSVEFENAWYLDVNETGLYTGASQITQIKIIAGVTGGMLDFVLMDREAFDIFSNNGYLLDLDELPSLREFSDYFVQNEILPVTDETDSDRNSPDSGEPQTDPQADTAYASDPIVGSFGIDLSASEFYQKAGFEQSVYLGIINSSQRLGEAAAYVHYLFDL